jgi:predicted RecB family nuclease
MALLTKSTFLKGHQCHKYIYLDKYYKKEKDPLTEEQRIKFEGGHIVGAMAQKLFAGGLDVSLISKSNDVLVQETKKLIEQGHTIIYEATFEYNNVHVRADIILKEGDKWKIYEIKSSQKISDTNRIDAALQYYVMKGSELIIKEFHLACLNYPRAEVIEMKMEDVPTDLFQFEDVTTFCEEQLITTEEKIKALKTTLALPSIPNIATGEHCNYPYTCEFKGFCNKSQEEINEGLFS